MSLIQDVRYALRQLKLSPGFAVTAILTLSLGIGANTAIFSVVNGLLLRPPGGIRGFDELVTIYTSDYSGPPYGSSSLPDISEFAAVSGLSGVAAYTVSPVILSDGSADRPAEMVLGQTVTPNFFDVLGARAFAGRTFAGDEGEPGGRSDVVVLGHAFWQSRYAGDPAITGSTIRIGGVPYTVIGIAGPDFNGLLPGLSPAFYVPIGAPGVSDRAMLENRGNRGLLAIGRLAGGTTVEQARTQLQLTAQTLHAAYPDAWTDINGAARRVSVIPAAQATIPPQMRGPVTGFVAVLMAIVGGVLLIGCVNIANLLLARATGREREIALRLAVGAGRGRLIQQLLTESMVLAVLGAVLGVALAWAGTRALTLATTSLPLPVQVRLDIAPDLRVLVFAGIITAIAGGLFGLTPALMATRRSLTGSVHREGGAARKLRLRSVLAASQIAIAMVLLIAGGLLLRSLKAAQSIDPGFHADGLLSVNLAFNQRNQPPEQRVQLQRELVERVQALPGVASASYASVLPLGAGGGRRSFGIEGYQPGEAEDMEIHWSQAGPGYFRTMETRLLRGREFEPRDALNAPTTAIVNEAFARRYLPGQDPIGKRMNHGGDAPFHIEIIGLAQDGKYVSLGEDPRPFVWMAADQHPGEFLTLVVRSADPGKLTQPIRRIISELDADAAITGVVLGNRHLAFALLPQKIGARLLTLFAALGLLIAAVGIYGVMAFAVNQRTREFGVRLAMGARTEDITRMVMRRGMIVTGFGMLAGIAVAIALTRFMQFMLFDIAALDVLTFSLAAGIVGATALIANWLPARRTARVDPLRALRFD